MNVADLSYVLRICVIKLAARLLFPMYTVYIHEWKLAAEAGQLVGSRERVRVSICNLNR
jgi:hypothetical protein